VVVLVSAGGAPLADGLLDAGIRGDASFPGCPRVARDPNGIGGALEGEAAALANQPDETRERNRIGSTHPHSVVDAGDVRVASSRMPRPDASLNQGHPQLSQVLASVRARRFGLAEAHVADGSRGRNLACLRMSPVPALRGLPLDRVD